MENKSDIGIIGFGVMGENIALNCLSKKYRVSLYNYQPENTVRFL